MHTTISTESQIAIESALGKLYDFLRDLVDAEIVSADEAAVLMDDVSQLWAWRWQAHNAG